MNLEGLEFTEDRTCAECGRRGLAVELEVWHRGVSPTYPTVCSWCLAAYVAREVARGARVRGKWMGIWKDLT